MCECDALLLEESEMARRLHIEVKHLRLLSREGVIPHITIFGKRRYSPKWVEDWINGAHHKTFEELFGTNRVTTQTPKNRKNPDKNCEHGHTPQVKRRPKGPKLQVFGQKEGG